MYWWLDSCFAPPVVVVPVWCKADSYILQSWGSEDGSQCSCPYSHTALHCYHTGWVHFFLLPIFLPSCIVSISLHITLAKMFVVGLFINVKIIFSLAHPWRYQRNSKLSFHGHFYILKSGFTGYSTCFQFCKIFLQVLDSVTAYVKKPFVVPEGAAQNLMNSPKWWHHACLKMEKILRCRSR